MAIELADDGDKILVSSESMAESGNDAAARWGADLTFIVEVKDPLAVGLETVPEMGVVFAVLEVKDPR